MPLVGPKYIVARAVASRLSRELRVCKEAKRTKTVVDRHDDDFFRCQARAIIGDNTSGAAREPATIDPEKTGEILSREARGIVVCWRPDIHAQAVLARGILAGGENAGIAESLRALRAELGGVEHAIPRMRLLGRFPAIGACWWSS